MILLHAFSSEPSSQFASPLQNNSLSMHTRLPHASLPGSHIGSSVANKGYIILGPKKYVKIYI